MRIRSLDIKGFRAFSGETQFDLDGDIVLVAGVNGQGKTSLFDAILWALTGEISRLKSRGSIVSLYSSSGEAQVRVTIASPNGQDILVTRRSDGQSDRLLVQEGDDSYQGKEAEFELIQRLWPEGATANDPRSAMRVALERGVYLQQDVLTDFLTADSDNERFNAVSEIMGAGLVTELQTSLENSRRAWSRATNQMKPRIEEAEERRSRIEAQLKDFSDAGSVVSVNSNTWTAWWTQVGHLGVSNANTPRVDSSDAHAAVDVAMAELRAIRISRERRGERLRELGEAIQEMPSTPLELDELHQAAEESNRALVAAQETLSEAEATVSEIRRRQTESRFEQDELRILAEVALRHLGEHCPVCQQTYDKEATRQRLDSLVSSATSILVGLAFAGTPDLVQLAVDVQSKENEASVAASVLQNAQRQERARAEIHERVHYGLSELSIDIPSGSEAASEIEAELERINQDLETLAALRSQGEGIALSLARAGQLTRKAELEQELIQVNNELGSGRREITIREETGELISNMIRSLREASSDLVESELKRLDGLLQRIYTTADPHPEFRVVRLLSSMRQGHGTLFAEVEDPIRALRKDNPRAFLSSSQLNVLAVSVFLALNLGMPKLPLRVAMLDDPLQSLDDLNLLGLIDLLKRTREQRQLMMSTHDRRFASLLDRKLRPVSDSQRTIHVELSGWTSEGPVANQYDIQRDPVPIRIAAA